MNTSGSPGLISQFYIGILPNLESLGGEVAEREQVRLCFSDTGGMNNDCAVQRGRGLPSCVSFLPMDFV
jgi:hypothetical protein